MSHCVTRQCRRHLFTNYARLHRVSPTRRAFSQAPALLVDLEQRDSTNDYKRRVSQLEQARGSLENCYPLLKGAAWKHTTLQDFRTVYESQLEAKELKHNEQVLVAGRVQSVRAAGNKLVFLDLQQDGHTLQVMCQLGKLNPDANGDLSHFKSFARLVRKGDWYEVLGWPHRSDSGELSILACSLPQLLAPSLHQVPNTLEDAETRARSRHVDMLVNPEAVQTLRIRHLVEQHLNDFFTKDGFVKVSTPILSAGAGGAVARPFETEATELDGQTLNLRIAPELWLKRLVVGGMEKVYEIGPAFRNEGVDNTHNPEFYTCEFYEALASLEGLMAKTEDLLVSMSKSIETVRESRLSTLSAPDISFQAPFQRLEFFPTLERQMGSALPNLSEPGAFEQVQKVLKENSVAVPANATLPRLLDALCAHYIEPLCQEPTFITHHPAVLSPLSKHTMCPRTHQLIALRAELFIQAREYANMYEEENSPFAQRRKFRDQLAFRAVDGEGDTDGGLDESYLEALEWGLPPTGGWGCGLDRLVMLFSGRDRISDVLAFGTLRNVVGLRRGK